MECVDLEGRVVELYWRKKRQADDSCGGYIYCDTSTLECLAGRVPAGTELMLDKPAGLGLRFRILILLQYVAPTLRSPSSTNIHQFKTKYQCLHILLSLNMISLDPSLEPLPLWIRARQLLQPTLHPASSILQIVSAWCITSSSCGVPVLPTELWKCIVATEKTRPSLFGWKDNLSIYIVAKVIWMTTFTAPPSQSNFLSREVLRVCDGHRWLPYFLRKRLLLFLRLYNANRYCLPR